MTTRTLKTTLGLCLVASFGALAGCASDDAVSAEIDETEELEGEALKTACNPPKGRKVPWWLKPLCQTPRKPDAGAASPDAGHALDGGHVGGGGDGGYVIKSPEDFPPPPPGYTRIVAPVIKKVQPGKDAIYCQYVQAPSDRDLDILDIVGWQSEGGHHAVAYSSTAKVPVGTSRECNDEDNAKQGSYLGGVGEGGGKLPPGVAFRLSRGTSLMLSNHFLNTTDHEFDGYSVVDVKFAEADPNRTVASLFVNMTTRFQIPAQGTAHAEAKCTVQKPMRFIMMANHMHDHGASAITELIRKDGTTEVIRDDPKWSYEMQFQPVYTNWSLENALALEPGDTLRTRCNWNNSSSESAVYPREMCIGVGFFLSDGKTIPGCQEGFWFEGSATASGDGHGETGGGHDAGTPTPDAGTPPVTEPPKDAGTPPVTGSCTDPIAPTAEAVTQVVFQRSCGLTRSCHAGSAPVAGVDLSSVDGLFATAVGKPSSQAPSLSLITPGKPESSYLVRKLRNTHSVGTVMPPPPSAALCESKIQAVEAWIRAGAQR